MLKKKQKVIGKIVKFNPNGLGIINNGKDTILVNNVMIDEEVEVIILKKVKEGYFADLIRVIKPSSKRIKVKCNYFKNCGNCSYLYKLYPFELKDKTLEMKELVNKYNLKLNVNNIVGMKEPIAYRNKCIISFNKYKDMKAGFYQVNSHNIVDIDSCLLHDEYTNNLIRDLKRIVKKCKIEIYNEDKRSGFLRHIQIRRGVVSNQTMITLVVSEKSFKGKKNFINEIIKLYPDITTIVQNINPRSTSVVLGNEEINLYGKGYIIDELCGLNFKISSKSFYQINHDQCVNLYEKAIDLLDIKSNDVIIDTYCGIGTLSLIASKKCKKVYGVEINSDAIKDAKENANLNNITNVEFYNDDASDYMESCAQKNMRIDGVIMDPARDGSNPKFLDAIIKLKPRRVVYISCNPDTQLRDIKYLSKYYSYQEMYLYDMFPRTKHVETIICLNRK